MYASGLARDVGQAVLGTCGRVKHCLWTLYAYFAGATHLEVPQSASLS